MGSLHNLFSGKRLSLFVVLGCCLFLFSVTAPAAIEADRPFETTDVKLTVSPLDDTQMLSPPVTQRDDDLSNIYFPFVINSSTPVSDTAPISNTVSFEKRITEGLESQFAFDEGDGLIVSDAVRRGQRIGAEPWQLVVTDESAISWVPGGLAINSPTRLVSTTPLILISQQMLVVTCGVLGMAIPVLYDIPTIFIRKQEFTR
ncbi:MAG: hypothetical protein B6242_05050 [Anaerolineaceae bacterium 4572_78]|nr:MAG: hypothetical protein B6242_05050 [Anaerolineaceae bacterium 4572_78]